MNNLGYLSSPFSHVLLSLSLYVSHFHFLLPSFPLFSLSISLSTLIPFLSPLSLSFYLSLIFLPSLSPSPLPLSQALSLRQQVECLRKERVEMGMEVDSLCGPWAPCGQRLESMEAAHRRALMELQESHAREVRELQRQRERLLQEESQATAQGEKERPVGNSV